MSPRSRGTGLFDLMLNTDALQDAIAHQIDDGLGDLGDDLVDDPTVFDPTTPLAAASPENEDYLNGGGAVSPEGDDVQFSPDAQTPGQSPGYYGASPGASPGPMSPGYGAPQSPGYSPGQSPAYVRPFLDLVEFVVVHVVRVVCVLFVLLFCCPSPPLPPPCLPGKHVNEVESFTLYAKRYNPTTNRVVCVQATHILGPRTYH